MKKLSKKYQFEISDEEIVVYPMAGDRVVLEEAFVLEAWICNAFSLQMLEGETGIISFEVEEISEGTGMEIAPYLKSAVGHPDTAAVLAVEPNRVSISLNKGDIMIVAQLVGGRLPEGATTLPEGYAIKFYLMELGC